MRSIALLSILLLVGLSCDQRMDDVEPKGSATQSDDLVRMESAALGMEWLIQHVDEMPPGWQYPFLIRLHRVAPDELVAARIRTELRNEPRKGRRTLLPADLDDPTLLNPDRMTPILFELGRRRAYGEPYLRELSGVQRLIEDNAEHFWMHTPRLQKAVYLHELAELGIAVPFSITSLFQEYKHEIKSRPMADVTKDVRSLYELSHLIFARSGYFRVFVEDGEFEPMIPFMKLALSENMRPGTTISKLDASAEILACLSLMKAPDDDRVARARATLIEAQFADGSWGAGEGVSRERVHATLVGVLGVIVFPEALRPDPDLNDRLGEAL